MKVIDTPLFWAIVVLSMVGGYFYYIDPNATAELLNTLDTLLRSL